MTLVHSAWRGGLVELTYRAAPGTYHVVYCQLESRRCSCVRGERTDCLHLDDAARRAEGAAQAAA